MVTSGVVTGLCEADGRGPKVTFSPVVLGIEPGTSHAGPALTTELLSTTRFLFYFFKFIFNFLGLGI